MIAQMPTKPQPAAPHRPIGAGLWRFKRLSATGTGAQRKANREPGAEQQHACPHHPCEVQSGEGQSRRCGCGRRRGRSRVFGRFRSGRRRGFRRFFGGFYFFFRFRFGRRGGRFGAVASGPGARRGEGWRSWEEQRQHGRQRQQLTAGWPKGGCEPQASVAPLRSTAAARSRAAAGCLVDRRCGCRLGPARRHSLGTSHATHLRVLCVRLRPRRGRGRGKGSREVYCDRWIASFPFHPVPGFPARAPSLWPPAVLTTPGSRPCSRSWADGRRH